MLISPDKPTRNFLPSSSENTLVKNRTLHFFLSFAKEPILDNGLETKVKTITSPEPHYPTFLHDCFSGITMDLYSIMNSFLQPNFADHHS